MLELAIVIAIVAITLVLLGKTFLKAVKNSRNGCSYSKCSGCKCQGNCLQAISVTGKEEESAS